MLAGRPGVLFRLIGGTADACDAPCNRLGYSPILTRPTRLNRPIASRVAALLAVFAVLAGLIAGPQSARANSLGKPDGEVLLTVTGQIARTNRDGTMVFDRAMLEQLPQTSFTTTTIWTEGKHRFTGVTLADLLDAVRAKGDTLRATALNDYEITMPVEDARDGALVAYAMDGEAMSVREKGPLWIVYPYDSDISYQSETVYARSIWQLYRIRVED